MNDTPRVTVPVDELAQEIRRVDGNHDLGAGALAEALMPFLSSRLSAAPAPEGGAVAEALQRLRVLRDQARNGTPVSDPNEHDADELDAILSVIEPALAPAEAGVAQRVMSRADLTNATTPGHADAYLNALLDYTAGFYGEAREAGMPATSVADAMNHVERAARGLHALALRAQPQAREDAQPVSWDGRGKCDCSDDTGLCPHCFPDDQPAPSHPAPDALRVAVEALEMIHAEVHVLREEAGLVSVRAHRLNKWWAASGEALAALQAEQKGGA